MFHLPVQKWLKNINQAKQYSSKKQPYEHRKGIETVIYLYQETLTEELMEIEDLNHGR